ncbi:MAG: glycosyltransferase family 39 protein [Flavobacteriales bacterium]
MALAAVLRFWDLSHIPYTPDELSALLRLYPTIGETIQKGVMEGDTHPPGVQVFEWLWTRAFGMSEVAVKLPFILMGLAALFFVYRVACAWVNTSVGLITVALLSTLQYTVTYGQIARPYAFGFFTCALLLDQLTRYAATDRRSALVGFALAASLCAYSHHFALLFAVLVTLGGVLLLRKKQMLPYVLACAGALLLYVPNIPILLHQFGKGGLTEWLAPPGSYWLRDYAAWIIMYSWPLAIALAGVAAWSTLNSVRLGKWRERLPWLMLLWGLAPLIIGYAYSVRVAPVLQYSMLIFSLPCLFLAMFHGLPKLNTRWSTAIVLGFTVLGEHGLIAKRDHYDLFYNSKYEAFANAVHSAGPRKLVIIDAPQGVMDFYGERSPESDPRRYVLLSQVRGTAHLQRLLSDPAKDEVLLGITPSTLPELSAIVQQFFPEFVSTEHYCEGTILRLRRGPHTTPKTNVKELPLSVWSDSTVVEYPAIVEADVRSVIEGNNDVIEVRATFRAGSNDDIVLAGDLFNEGKSVIHRENHMDNTGVDAGGRITLHLAFNLSDYEMRGRNLHFKAYVHNHTGRWFGTPEIVVAVRPGNPVVYGLYEPIGGN